MTLFTIPGLTDPHWLEEVRLARPWLEFVPHGATHPHSRECQHWTGEDTRRYISEISLRFGFAKVNEAPGRGRLLTRGFKAPGWQISDATLQVLSEMSWWVADQPYNQGRRPKGMRYYELPFTAGGFSFGGNGGIQIHGHVGHMGGHNANELELIMPDILKLKDSKFGYIRNHLDRVDQMRWHPA